MKIVTVIWNLELVLKPNFFPVICDLVVTVINIHYQCFLHYPIDRSFLLKTASSIRIQLIHKVDILCSISKDY